MPSTVQDVYNTVSCALMENSDDGTAPGLSLGIVTLADFLALFSVVVEDFSSRLGLVWTIFSTQLNAGISSYDVPENLNEVEQVYVGGQTIDFATIFTLDQWEYNWRGKTGTPEYWHLDGLNPKTLGVALTPDYTGAGYSSPVTFTGTVDTDGTTATWVSGNEFQTSWNNYTTAPTVTINSVDYTLSSVNSALTLDTVEDLGTQTGVAYSITIPAAPPPYGVYGLFNGSTVGQFSGTLALTGTAAVWASGSTFDSNWNNYYPRPNVFLSTDQITYVAWPMDSVTDLQNLTLLVGPGTGTYYFRVGIGNDGNLTMVGPKGLPSITYTLDSEIPDTIPNSFVPGIAYGILARIFSGDSEARDLQRAAYCQARYLEYCGVGGSISGELVSIGR